MQVLIVSVWALTAAIWASSMLGFGVRRFDVMNLIVAMLNIAAWGIVKPNWLGLVLACSVCCCSLIGFVALALVDPQ